MRDGDVRLQWRVFGEMTNEIHINIFLLVCIDNIAM